MLINHLGMLTSETAKVVIKQTVKTSIISFAKRNLNKVSNFQILDLIIPKERKIRSIVGGLETSLGTTLWEPLAKALASQNGFEVVNSQLERPTHMPATLSKTLQSIIEERTNGSGLYTAITSHDEIKKVCQPFVKKPLDAFEKPASGRGIDIWLRKDNINYFFDTKTVQPNVGDFTSYMIQILTWYAHFYSKYPTGEAVARIVFPYNPYKVDFWTKTIGKKQPLEKDNEAWVENQFWNFCSGLPNTFEIIIESFKELQQSKELEQDFEKLFK